MGIELSGVDEFIKSMQAKAKKLESKSEKTKILKAGAEPIRKAMADRAPRGIKKTDTWQYKVGKKYAIEHLKDNIIASDVKTDANGEEYIAVGPEAHFFYGPFLEFGTSKMASQPFAEPAVIEKKNESLQAMAEETKKVIEGV